VGIGALVGLWAQFCRVPIGATTQAAPQAAENTAEDRSPGRDQDSSGRQGTPPRREDEQTIRKLAAAYAEAFNKGDLKGLTEVWAADGEYVDESGKTTQGREALAAHIRKALANRQDRKLKIQVRLVRFLKPDVALEEGTTELVDPDGQADKDRYLAIWVKNDGQWLLKSVRDLPASVDAEPPSPYERLKELDWLVGDWVGGEKPDEVTVTCRWAEGRSFLLQEFKVKRPDGTVFVASQRIGWDPLTSQIRSWVFDSKGGYGGGFWNREGNKWRVDAAGVLPDGRVGSLTNVWNFVNENEFVWKSTGREVEGQPLADHEFRLVRTPAKP
jgi:uncharacterized protein (TIGR02246 family)